MICKITETAPEILDEMHARKNRITVETHKMSFSFPDGREIILFYGGNEDVIITHIPNSIDSIITKEISIPRYALQKFMEIIGGL